MESSTPRTRVSWISRTYLWFNHELWLCKLHTLGSKGPLRLQHGRSWPRWACRVINIFGAWAWFLWFWISVFPISVQVVLEFSLFSPELISNWFDSLSLQTFKLKGEKWFASSSFFFDSNLNVSMILLGII